MSEAELHRIKRLVYDYFSVNNKVQFVCLFGSMASGRQHTASDIDIAIDTGERLNPEELVQYATQLATLLGREVDLVDISVARGALLEEIVLKGLTVVQRSPEVFASLLKRMWYDKEDDGRVRQRTMMTRLNLWPK